MPFAPIRANVTVAMLRRISRGGLLRPAHGRDEARQDHRERQRTDAVGRTAGRLAVRRQPAAGVFGRAFATDPRLLLLDEPTRGVDVGAKAEIYELIDRAAADGMAVLVASSELEELLSICHRIAVMNHGRAVEVIDHADATQGTDHDGGGGHRPDR